MSNVIDSIPQKLRWPLGIGVGFVLLVGFISIQSVYDSWMESRKLAQTQAEEQKRAELNRVNREKRAAIEAAKSPEQREAERLAREAKIHADEKLRARQAKEEEKARIAQAKAEATAERERAKRPENIIMANARKSAKIYEDGGNLVVECYEYIFPYDINSRLKWVRAVCDADATIKGGPRSFFFYDPSGKKFAQADTLRGIRLIE